MASVYNRGTKRMLATATIGTAAPPAKVEQSQCPEEGCDVVTCQPE